MKIADAQSRVLEAALNQVGGDIDREEAVRSSTELVALVVKLTVEAIGFHLATDGEICDPRPAKPDSRWQPPSPANWKPRR